MDRESTSKFSTQTALLAYRMSYWGKPHKGLVRYPDAMGGITEDWSSYQGRLEDAIRRLRLTEEDLEEARIVGKREYVRSFAVVHVRDMYRDLTVMLKAYRERVGDMERAEELNTAYQCLTAMLRDILHDLSPLERIQVCLFVAYSKKKLSDAVSSFYQYLLPEEFFWYALYKAHVNPLALDSTMPVPSNPKGNKQMAIMSKFWQMDNDFIQYLFQPSDDIMEYRSWIGVEIEVVAGRNPQSGHADYYHPVAVINGEPRFLVQSGSVYLNEKMRKAEANRKAEDFALKVTNNWMGVINSIFTGTLIVNHKKTPVVFIGMDHVKRVGHEDE